MKDKIIDLIRTRGAGTSFVELSNLDGFHGELEMKMKDNLVLWANVSSKFVDALNQLLLENKIKIKMAGRMIYLLDGQLMSYPIAKQFRAYKKPHWLPVVFSLP